VQFDLLASRRADPIVARCAPFAVFLCLLVAVSAIPVSRATGLATDGASWLIVLRGALVAIVLVWFWPSYVELRNGTRVRGRDWTLAVVTGVAVFTVWIAFDQDWAVLSRSVGFIPHDPDGAMDWTKALARLAGFALAVPVMEELFWRSFLLR
jgi:hypothetical protein